MAHSDIKDSPVPKYVCKNGFLVIYIDMGDDE